MKHLETEFKVNHSRSILQDGDHDTKEIKNKNSRNLDLICTEGYQGMAEM